MPIKLSYPYYAIIPAAGRSRRMGTDKLLLPWPPQPKGIGASASKETASDTVRNNDHWTVLDQVLSVWTKSRVDQVFITLRAGSSRELRKICEVPNVTCVEAVEPPDMKASVQAALQYLKSKAAPTDGAFCFVAPADLPTLSHHVVESMIAHSNSCREIIVPTFEGKTGHPILFPWEKTELIFELGKDQGMDSILKNEKVIQIDFPKSMYGRDIDTPEDYKSGI